MNGKAFEGELEYLSEDLKKYLLRLTMDTKKEDYGLQR